MYFVVLNRPRRISRSRLRNNQMLRQLEERQDEMRGLSREAWELLERLPRGVGRDAIARRLCTLPHDAARYGEFVQKLKWAIEGPKVPREGAAK